MTRPRVRDCARKCENGVEMFYYFIPFHDGEWETTNIKMCEIILFMKDLFKAPVTAERRLPMLILRIVVLLQFL